MWEIFISQQVSIFRNFIIWEIESMGVGFIKKRDYTVLKFYLVSAAPLLKWLQISRSLAKRIFQIFVRSSKVSSSVYTQEINKHKIQPLTKGCLCCNQCQKIFIGSTRNAPTNLSQVIYLNKFIFLFSVLNQNSNFEKQKL